MGFYVPPSYVFAMKSDKIGETPVFSRLLTESYYNVIVNALYNTSCFRFFSLFPDNFLYFHAFSEHFRRKSYNTSQIPRWKFCWHESLSSPLLSANCPKICGSRVCYDLGFLVMRVTECKMDTAATFANIS